MKPTRQQMQRAELAGRAARQAGKNCHHVPPYGSGEFARLMEEAWLDGWDDEDRHIAKRREVMA